jgi:DNA primase small subunit
MCVTDGRGAPFFMEGAKLFEEHSKMLESWHRHKAIIACLCYQLSTHSIGLIIMPPATSDAMITDEPVGVVEESSMAKKSNTLFTPELLHMYYQRLFPYHFMHQWLCYDPSNPGKTSKLFSRREFSFTIMIDTEEIYIRYQSFNSEQEFKKAILDRKPVKIDIGAVFSHPPKDHKSLQTGVFQTQQRELVFDIDLTDYDEIRKCGCSGASICNKCWKFMSMAIKVMEEGLREDFGFEHIAWFYSGRRGVHAWICDERARDLSNEARSAVASYFEVRAILACLWVVLSF